MTVEKKEKPVFVQEEVAAFHFQKFTLEFRSLRPARLFNGDGSLTEFTPDDLHALADILNGQGYGLQGQMSEEDDEDEDEGDEEELVPPTHRGTEDFGGSEFDE